MCVDDVRVLILMEAWGYRAWEHKSLLRAGLRVEDQIKTLAELMMRRRLFVKADRMFKKPKPGKKRLAKWPKKLIPMYADQVNLSLFYCIGR